MQRSKSRYQLSSTISDGACESCIENVTDLREKWLILKSNDFQRYLSLINSKANCVAYFVSQGIANI